jgi:hypothetical protein
MFNTYLNVEKMSSSEVKNRSSYFTGDTLRLRYRAQPLNAT